MVKRRPVVVLCPSISWRPGLCTVVGLSTTAPDPVRSYHCKLILNPPLPHPWAAEMWVKGDMVATVGFHRLDLIRLPGQDESKRRIYRMNPLAADQLKDVRTCVLRGLGMFQLTRHL